MKLEFDSQADAAYLEISDAEIESTREIEPDIAQDYVCGREILSISKPVQALPVKNSA